MKKITLLAFMLLFSALSFAQVNLTNGLIAYYPFNGNANDASGNANNGTVNGATLGTDRFGNANSSYEFSGNTITAAVMHKIEEDFTISLWFGAALSPTNLLTWIGEANPSDYDVFRFRYYDITGTPTYRSEIEKRPFSTGSACESHDADFLANLINSGVNFQHYVLVREADSMFVFLNNIKVSGTSAVFTVCTTQDSLKDITLGNSGFSGGMDDIMIYNRAINTAEIDSIFNLTASLAPVTGLNQIIETEINIYPNPTNDVIQIELPIFDSYQITVMDMTGRIVYNIRNLNTDTYKLDAKNWSSGMYNINITNSKGELTSKKIVKQ